MRFSFQFHFNFVVEMHAQHSLSVHLCFLFHSLQNDWLFTVTSLTMTGNFASFQGLRVTALFGVFGTCIGAWIKVFSVDPGLFYVGFIGQSIVALSQVTFLNSFNHFYSTFSLNWLRYIKNERNDWVKMTLEIISFLFSCKIFNESFREQLLKHLKCSNT